jgi:hypothetical protein
MRVFAYAFKAGKWVETPRLSVRDVALLVDTEGRTIYIWHGPKSKIKDQNEAKKLLLSLRDRYSSFQFQKVSRNPPPELQQEIKRLLGSPLGQGRTRVFAIIGMIAGLAAVSLCIAVIYILYTGPLTTPPTVAWLTNTADYNVGYLEVMMWVTGFSMIAFGVSFVFSLLSKRWFLVITEIIGVAFGVFLILYVDFLRPGLNNPSLMSIATTFSLFQTLVLVLELIAFVPFLIGFLAEIIRILQEG